METCIYKILNYHITKNCNSCTGEPTKMCYNTRDGVQNHVERFYELFGLRLETKIISEEEMEMLDSWDFKNFGCGFE